MEVHGEQTQLLDDLILDMDEKDEVETVGKEKQTRHEAKLSFRGKHSGERSRKQVQ